MAVAAAGKKDLPVADGASDTCAALPSPIRDEEIRIKYDITMTSLAASMPSNAFRWLSENR
jgi:hypothetical protein